jgi:hypothetical protein
MRILSERLRQFSYAWRNEIITMVLETKQEAIK